MDKEQTMTELWKDIPQYAEYYQASTHGRIRAKDRIVTRTRNGVEHQYLRRGRIMKAHIEGSGYWQTLITVPGLKKHEKIHRLVSFAWLDNPDGKRCVNHKDGDKSNNVLQNLEWVTHSENLIHAHKTGLKKPQQLGKSGSLHHRSSAVISVNSTAIIEHGSIREASRYFGCDPKTISNHINADTEFQGNKIYLL